MQTTHSSEMEAAYLRARAPMPDYPADRRRAVEVLSNLPESATEALLMAHGISPEVMAGLTRSGLNVTRFRITDSGRVVPER